MPRHHGPPVPDPDKAAQVLPHDVEAAKEEARRAAPPRLRRILRAKLREKRG